MDPYANYEPLPFDIYTVVKDLEKKIKLSGLKQEEKKERAKIRKAINEEKDIEK